MTISTTANKVIVSGNGSTTTFNFNFIYGSGSAISVYYTDNNGNTTLLSPSSYTLNLNSPQPTTPPTVPWGLGGSVVYPAVGGTPIATGTQLTIVREVAEIQATPFANQTGNYTAVLEAALDYLTLQVQDLQEQANRSIQIPVTDSNGLTTQLPSWQQRKNQALLFDNNGNIIVGAGSGGGGGGSGTVTSVGLTGDGVIFNATVTGSPVTTSGSLVPVLLAQAANKFLAGPTSGGSATPTIRSIVAADLPATYLVNSNNLSDLTNASSARTNLGLGSAALLASSAILLAANNLSDLNSASTARTNLGLGTMATQAASNVNITGGAITGLGTPVNPTDAANKAYVDNATTNLTQKASCVVVTVANLTATYSNGSSGVGATLTNSGTQLAFAADGVSPTMGQRVLVTGQSTQYQNGIYTLTTVGSGSTNWVLTRATDFNSSGTIAAGDYVVITSGTTYTGTLWFETGIGPFTVGATAIVFTEITVASQTLTFTGDVTGTGTSTIALTIAALAVTTAKIAANAVTYAKMQTGTANSLGGYDGSGNANNTTLNANPGLVIGSGTIGINALIFNVKDYGAKGDGSTNDNTAIANCIAAAVANITGVKGGVVYFPSGTYVVTQQFTATLVSNCNLFFKGDGIGISVIQWTTATGGVQITYNSGSYTRGLVGADGLTFQTLTANGGSGLTLISATVPNPGPAKKITNCAFIGNNSTTYWTNGILFDACCYTTINNCFFNALAGNLTVGTGILYQNSQNAVDADAHHISHNFFWGLNIGISAVAGPGASGIEGIEVTNCDFICGSAGISWIDNNGRPELNVTACQIQATGYSILTQNVTQMTICNNLLYNGGLGGGSNYVGIYVDNTLTYGTSDNSIIADNIIMCFGASSTNGVVLLNSQYCKVHDNRIDGATTGIWLKSGTTNCIVRNNYITNASNVGYLDQGTDNLCISDLAGYSAMVYMNATQAIGSGTVSVIGFQVVDHDPLGMYNGTNTFTVPAGVTKVKVAGNFNAGGSYIGVQALIEKNGVSSFPGHPGSYTGLNGYGAVSNISSGILYVSPGDTFTFAAAQSSGSTQNCGGTGATWFSIEIVG